MLQLDIFDNELVRATTSKKVGRSNKIVPEIVLVVVNDIKAKIDNKTIISKHSLSQRTFFRIKKGDYDHLLKEALDNAANDFSLELTD